MIIRCAWCKEVTGEKPPYSGKAAHEITDGICNSCLEKNFPHIAETIKKTGVKIP